MMNRSINSNTFWIVAACALLLPTAQAVESEEETKKLVEVLKSDKGVFDKAKACQRLAVVGTVDAVPALAELLSDEELAHYARFGLEPIRHPSVDEAFRAALGRLEGSLRIGVINSIGARRDAGAEEALVGLLGSEDQELVTAAAAALGRIGTPKAGAALRALLAGRAKDIGIRLGEAAIVCGEMLRASGSSGEAVSMFAAVRASDLPSHVRAAALRGETLTDGSRGVALLLEAIRGDDPVLRRISYGVAREIPGTEATLALVTALDDLPAEKRAQVLRALADRGDRAALPAVLALAGGEETSIGTRVAAIRALEALGDAAVVPRLVWAAAGEDSEVSTAARATLASMGGDDVDGAVLALLDIALRRGSGERGSSFLRTMVEVVGDRKIAASVRILREAARRDDPLVRLAAIRSLGTTVGLDDFAALVERLAATTGESEVAAIREALGMASRRMPSPADCARALRGAMEHAPTRSRVVLLGVFSAVGGPEGLAAVVESAHSPDESVRGAAIAALGDWPSESGVFKLLEIVPKLESSTDRRKAYEAFRASVRRLGFDLNRRIGACNEAMGLAKTDDERRLTIGALEGIPAPKTLNTLAAYLESETLGEHAASAMVTICERLIRTRQRRAVAPAVKKVLAATRNADLMRRARSLAKQAGGN